jgi:hypothetical protein
VAWGLGVLGWERVVGWLGVFDVKMISHHSCACSGVVLYAVLHAAVPYCVKEILGTEKNLSMPELIFRISLSYR